MTEVVSNTFFLQVRYQIINVLVGRCLERTTRREVDIACDLVDTEAARDIATLVRLFLQLLCPTFFNTLVFPD